MKRGQGSERHNRTEVRLNRHVQKYAYREKTGLTHPSPGQSMAVRPFH